MEDHFFILDKLIFKPLKVWGSEFGIPNQYTGFKRALDTALWSSQSLEKTNDPIPRKHPGKRRDRQKIDKTEGQINRSFFKGPLQVPTFLYTKKNIELGLKEYIVISYYFLSEVPLEN